AEEASAEELRYWRFIPTNAPNPMVGSLLKKSRIEMGTQPSRAHGKGRQERTAARRRFFPAPEQSWQRYEHPILMRSVRAVPSLLQQSFQTEDRHAAGPKTASVSIGHS